MSYVEVEALSICFECMTRFFVFAVQLSGHVSCIFLYLIPRTELIANQLAYKKFVGI